MSAASLPYYWYLAYVSGPAADRPIYREIACGQIRSIVELGVGDAVRTQRMLEVALRHHPASELRYAGIDLFEARESGPKLKLKEVHKLLSEQKITTRLVPGDPLNALLRVANALPGTDLVVIGADQSRESLAEAWRFLPRMLHAKSLVYLEEQREGYTEFVVLTTKEIERRALQATPAPAAVPMRRAA